MKLTYGNCPAIETRVENKEHVERLTGFSSEEHVPYVLDAIRLIKQQLRERLPLIGFSGAPSTLASYLIEGSPSREFIRPNKMMYDQAQLWGQLLSTLSRIATVHLLAQVTAA